MKTIGGSRVRTMLKKAWIESHGSVQGAAIYYGVTDSYLYNILNGVSPRPDMLDDIGVKRELVKTERFYKVEGK